MKTLKLSDADSETIRTTREVYEKFIFLTMMAGRAPMCRCVATPIFDHKLEKKNDE